MGTFRLVLDGVIGIGNQTRNVFTMDGGGSSSPSSTAVIEWMDSIFSSAILPLLSIDWASSRIIVELPDGSGHWNYSTEYPYVRAGTGTGDALPFQMALVLVGITPSRRRGKKFVAGFMESIQDGGRVKDSYLATFNTMANAYTQPLVDGATTFESGVCYQDGTNFLAFNGSRSDRVLGTQRRRKQGVGA